MMLHENDAARRLGLSVKTLQNWRNLGDRGPAYHKLGRRVLYDPADIDEWLRARRRTSTAQPSPGAATG